MHRDKRNRGVITVLVSLLMVGVLSVGTLSIEAGRYQAAKSQLAQANISAANSMIASYNTDLYAKYGLLAIDNTNFTVERAIDYLNFNSDQAIGYKGNRLSRFYAVDSVELTGLYNLTYPTMLKRQILYNAKYNVVPQNYGLNIYNIDALMTDLSAKCTYVQEQLYEISYCFNNLDGTAEDVPADVDNALLALEATFADLKRYDADCDVTLSDSTVQLLPSTTGTVESAVPQEDLDDIHTALNNALDVIGGVAGMLDYTQRDPVYNDFILGGSNIHKMVEENRVDYSELEEEMWGAQPYVESVRALCYDLKNPCYVYFDDVQKESDLLLNSYIVDAFSNRTNRLNGYVGPEKGTSVDGTMENATFSSACVEYIIGGSESEKENQAFAHHTIQCIYLINDLYTLMTESEHYNQYNKYSVISHIIWAYYESLIDTELVVNYGISVPFNKDRMILPINSADTVAQAFASHNLETALKELGFYEDDTIKIPGSNAYSYIDCLLHALFYIDDQTKLLRVADMIQMETRYSQQYVENKTATFLMANQNTYCRIKCVGKFNAALPMLSLNTGNTTRGLEFQSIKYAGY